MLPQIHQGVMNSWHIPKKYLKEEEKVRYSNGWNPLSSKPQINNIKEYHSKKKEERKEEAQVASTSKPQANQLPKEVKKNKKKNWKKTYYPSYRIQRIQKEFHGKCLQNDQKLDGIQGQRGAKNEKTPFPKEIALSPDVVNTLTEIKKINYL
ncbi:hypothetical protein O181_052852 [Austropuccinia psidii MF-1]|uniref:Uncharacterized protein n=1 Tax=Austropuccinia psidii MF-1 TaxID=1389203 RepID=A0A9Q3E8J6_9BASI|nr:hypothetical protein [Austropuccinia psidii MF-1]